MRNVVFHVVCAVWAVLGVTTAEGRKGYESSFEVQHEQVAAVQAVQVRGPVDAAAAPEGEHHADVRIDGAQTRRLAYALSVDSCCSRLGQACGCSHLLSCVDDLHAFHGKPAAMHA